MPYLLGVDWLVKTMRHSLQGFHPAIGLHLFFLLVEHCRKKLYRRGTESVARGSKETKEGKRKGMTAGQLGRRNCSPQYLGSPQYLASPQYLGSPQYPTDERCSTEGGLKFTAREGIMAFLKYQMF
ncbi:hypothetical protein EYF80_044393 [Liparis tanakae]|uniref:Uncharacterized protein n=1 Tax=Liparis tanakae TaxID=230148 RepID=A0A4Z2FVZ7_9TELE|nr:hypothetical protein EYF80_044393 [Liparis tanakae]